MTLRYRVILILILHAHYYRILKQDFSRAFRTDKLSGNCEAFEPKCYDTSLKRQVFYPAHSRESAIPGGSSVYECF